jgi:hypothetical protein
LALGLVAGENQPSLERVQHDEQAQVDQGDESRHPQNPAILDFGFSILDWRRWYGGRSRAGSPGFGLIREASSRQTHQITTPQGRDGRPRRHIPLFGELAPGNRFDPGVGSHFFFRERELIARWDKRTPDVGTKIMEAARGAT